MSIAISFVLVLMTAVALIVHRSHHLKRHPTANGLASSNGVVNTTLNPFGSVFIHSELWLARAIDDGPIPPQSKVMVIGSQDHLLLVTALPQTSEMSAAGAGQNNSSKRKVTGRHFPL